MKLVPCQNPDCDKHRVHHESPDEMRPRQMVQVPDNLDPTKCPVYCSITCACEAGAYDVKTGWKQKRPKLGDEMVHDGKVYTIVDVMDRLTPYTRPNQDTKVIGYTVGLKEKPL